MDQNKGVKRPVIYSIVYPRSFSFDSPRRTWAPAAFSLGGYTRARVCTIRDVSLCGTSSYTLPDNIDPLVYRGHASLDTIARSRVRSLTPFSLFRDNVYARAYRRAFVFSVTEI